MRTVLEPLPLSGATAVSPAFSDALTNNPRTPVPNQGLMQDQEPIRRRFVADDHVATESGLTPANEFDPRQDTSDRKRYAANPSNVVDFLAQERRIDGLASKSVSRPRGLMAAFSKACDRWDLGRTERLALLGFPGEDPLGEALLDGGIHTSSQDVRERAGYVVGLCITLAGLFDKDIEGELDWLHRPHGALQGKSPLAHMLQRRMKHLAFVSEVLRRERGL